MLTVLIPSRNRCDTLFQVLTAYCDLESPPGGWKLVVVDNGSSDNTAFVVGNFKDHLPVHYLWEPEKGKTRAMNAALPRAEGDLIVFTDDDVFPRSDWLVQVRKAADEHSDYSIFGGVVLPRWDSPEPEWARMLPEGGAFTFHHYPLPAEGPTDHMHIFGPNLAVRPSAFESGVGWTADYQDNGFSPMGNDTDLILKLEALGHKCWFARNAIVEHLVSRDRLTMEWVFTRARRFGQGYYRLHNAPKHLPLWFGIPRHLFRDIPKQVLIASAAFLRRDKSKFIRAWWDFKVNLGMAEEARRIGRVLHH